MGYPWKGHGTSGSIMGWRWGIRPWTDRPKYKHYLPVVPHTRVVTIQRRKYIFLHHHSPFNNQSDTSKLILDCNSCYNWVNNKKLINPWVIGPHRLKTRQSINHAIYNFWQNLPMQRKDNVDDGIGGRYKFFCKSKTDLSIIKLSTENFDL